MDTGFQTGKAGNQSTSVEWYTPPEIISSLGAFDLDPATSEVAVSINQSARHYFTKEDDGLSKEWFGRVWLNPPYSNPDIRFFMERMARHNNGIALVYNRCDSQWFQDAVLEKAHSILFLRSRIRFIKPDGTKGNSPGAGSVLIAYGEENTFRLAKSGLTGKHVKIELIASKRVDK